LSVTRRRYSVETVVLILKFFSQSGSPTILFFRTKRGGNIPTGPPPNGGVKCKDGMKKSRRDFRFISHFFSEIVQKKASYRGRQIRNRTTAFECCHLRISVTLNDPKAEVQGYTIIYC